MSQREADVSGWCYAGFSGEGCVVCKEDSYSEDCQDKCTFATCSNNGRCKGLDGSCLCYPGYSGSRCEIKDEAACGPGQSGPGCNACAKDSYSADCQAACKGPESCSGKGRCRGWDGSCICYPGFTGPDCSTPLPSVDTTPVATTPSPTPTPIQCEEGGACV